MRRRPVEGRFQFMRLLTYQAKHFGWKSFSKTLEDAPDQDVETSVSDAVVVFMHVETRDQDNPSRTFKYALKHIKWLANKRTLKTIVLHSFAHLGGENAEPSFSKALMDQLDERLTSTGYTVKQTPFGYFCSWELSVFGDSLAKVYKEI